MRDARLALLTVLLAVTSAAAGDKELVFSFRQQDLGSLPTGWSAAKTGTGEAGKWKVVADESAPSKGGYVLAHAGESPNAVFNVCVLDEGTYRDVQLSVAFKAVKGRNDQGGGIVWRYQDANNYYVARMNPLEDNYRLYHVINGRRTQIDSMEGLNVPAGQWHVLTITMTGDLIACHLDGKLELRKIDPTISKPGKVGLWTKSDAQTYFDDFKVSGK